VTIWQKQPIRQSGGRVAVPTGSGLGIEVDRALIDHYHAA
jgi:L-alanine-DL-glutamate epimerase-like enolase superfamily enzyme